MARFVPRMLRGRRTESPSGESAEQEPQQDDAAPVGSRPTPRRTAASNGETGDGPDDDAAAGRPVGMNGARRRPRPRSAGDQDAVTAPDLDSATGRDESRAPGDAQEPDDPREPSDPRMPVDSREPGDPSPDELEDATTEEGAETEAGLPGDPDEEADPDEEEGPAELDPDDSTAVRRTKQAPRRTGSEGEDGSEDGAEEAVATGSGARGAATRSRTAGAKRTKKASAGASREGRSKSGRKESKPERGKAGRKVVAAPRTGSNRRQRAAEAVINRLRRTALNLSVWLVVVALLLGTAWYFQARGDAVAKAGDDAMAAAQSAAESIFSYDYRAFDASVSNGKDFVTGKFKTEYAKTTAGLEKPAKKEKAIVRSEVSAASVSDVQIDNLTLGPERVEVLLFVNQFRRNVNISGEKVDENRVLLTMVYVEQKSGDGAWLVSDAAAI
ncbi:MAG: hypothetical protein ACRDTU_00565 [Micromonosporaceae bacterium]